MQVKKIGIAVLFVIVGVLGFMSLSSANEASIRKALKAAYPQAEIESIVKTPYGGLYEVFLGNQIVYTDETMSFMIVDGSIVDPKVKRDITRERLDELTKIDFKELPLHKAIKVVKGNGKRKLVVFSDVDCPFCIRLEKNELVHIDDVTIYTFLHPIDGLHPDAALKSKLIWCSPDRVAAWNAWIFEGKLPSKVERCEVPLEEVRALAHKFGAMSTPTMFFEDGRRMAGAQPHEEIEHYLKAASK